MTTPHQPINAVADFGADPTGQADSAAAIQSAINAAGALGAGGGAVYLPPGTYSIASASLVPVTGVRLFGDTRGGTRLRAGTKPMWNMGPATTVTNFELDHLLLTASTADIFRVPTSSGPAFTTTSSSRTRPATRSGIPAPAPG